MPPKLGINDAVDTLILAAKGFYDKQWLLGTSGNLSIRVVTDEEDTEALRFLITASGRDKGMLSAEDFVVVGEDGLVVAPREGQASAETLLHEGVYQAFPHVGAVYHVHTVAAALLSKYGAGPDGCICFEDLEMLKGLGFSTHKTVVALPVFDNSQDIAALSREVISRLDPEVPGFLIKGHGLYAWGETPFEAKRHVEIWEYLFQYKLGESLIKAGLTTMPLPQRV